MKTICDGHKIALDAITKAIQLVSNANDDNEDIIVGYLLEQVLHELYSAETEITFTTECGTKMENGLYNKRDMIKRLNDEIDELVSRISSLESELDDCKYQL